MTFFILHLVGHGAKRMVASQRELLRHNCRDEMDLILIVQWCQYQCVLSYYYVCKETQGYSGIGMPDVDPVS